VALSHTWVCDCHSFVVVVVRSELPSYDLIVKALLSGEGIESLPQVCRLTPGDYRIDCGLACWVGGAWVTCVCVCVCICICACVCLCVAGIPVQPMLAKPTKGISEVRDVMLYIIPQLGMDV